MRILFSLLAVMATLVPSTGADAAGAPACERRLDGNLYECFARATDPAGICYVHCLTAVDADDGFVFEQREGFANRTTTLRCACGDEANDLPGPRWFACVPEEANVALAVTGKVARAGRRIRRGAYEFAPGWRDDFTCRRVPTCTPDFLIPCDDGAAPP